ncbi:hypothetical protein NPIL_280561, partial [Nephila pilipes]
MGQFYALDSVIYPLEIYSKEFIDGDPDGKESYSNNETDNENN